ncbi:hypothetical protein HK102_005725 [Quaeritorhiza haematococci]|nr:hypothetical protein HK102_005725 [Quaeritorhiza haematococci]
MTGISLSGTTISLRSIFKSLTILVLFTLLTLTIWDLAAHGDYTSRTLLDTKTNANAKVSQYTAPGFVVCLDSLYFQRPQCQLKLNPAITWPPSCAEVGAADFDLKPIPLDEFPNVKIYDWSTTWNCYVKNPSTLPLPSPNGDFLPAMAFPIEGVGRPLDNITVIPEDSQFMTIGLFSPGENPRLVPGIEIKTATSEILVGYRTEEVFDSTTQKITTKFTVTYVTNSLVSYFSADKARGWWSHIVLQPENVKPAVAGTLYRANGTGLVTAVGTAAGISAFLYLVYTLIWGSQKGLATDHPASSKLDVYASSASSAQTLEANNNNSMSDAPPASMRNSYHQHQPVQYVAADHSSAFPHIPRQPNSTAHTSLVHKSSSSSGPPSNFVMHSSSLVPGLQQHVVQPVVGGSPTMQPYIVTSSLPYVNVAASTGSSSPGMTPTAITSLPPMMVGPADNNRPHSPITVMDAAEFVRRQSMGMHQGVSVPLTMGNQLVLLGQQPTASTHDQTVGGEIAANSQPLHENAINQMGQGIEQRQSSPPLEAVGGSRASGMPPLPPGYGGM